MWMPTYFKQLLIDAAERRRNAEAASRASQANLETAEIGVSEKTTKNRRRRKGLSGLTIQKVTDSLTGLNIPSKEDI